MGGSEKKCSERKLCYINWGSHLSCVFSKIQTHISFLVYDSRFWSPARSKQ